jgi:DNA-binding GntR family transcriptional regulator
MPETALTECCAANVADVTGADVADIYAGRAAVELAAVNSLTGHRDPAVHQNLASLVGRIERVFSRGDTAAVLDGDRFFHATLVAATDSPACAAFMDSSSKSSA